MRHLTLLVFLYKEANSIVQFGAAVVDAAVLDAQISNHQINLAFCIPTKDESMLKLRLGVDDFRIDVTY